MSPMSRPSCRLRARRPTPRQRRSPGAIGGFGGAEGLAAFLAARAHRRRRRRDPSVRFAHVGQRARTPAARPIRRSSCSPARPGRARPGDRWIEVATMDDAADALGAQPRTVFLTQGRLQLAAFARAPQHRYVVRAIDRPAEIDALPDCKLILARGPFSLADELALMTARADRSAGDQEQRRAARPTPRSRRRARFRSRSSSCAGRPRPKPKRCMISTRSWPGSPLIARPHRRAASASRPLRRRAAMKRVSLEPITTSVAMSASACVGFAERRQSQRLVGAPDRAGEGDRRRRRFRGSQQVERLRDAGPASPAKPDCKAR